MANYSREDVAQLRELGIPERAAVEALEVTGSFCACSAPRSEGGLSRGWH